tara:strand:+ start:873 stop:1007 length:135 start_codon:yes stop_codon:yes gene_type:complete
MRVLGEVRDEAQEIKGEGLRIKAEVLGVKEEIREILKFLDDHMN